MNSKFYNQVLEQIPPGSEVTKIYNGFEDGSLRIVVKLPDGRETRYFVHIIGEEVELEHRP